jgi:hypothetical protein
MTKPLLTTPSPGPLEDYPACFDDMGRGLYLYAR